jgi:hypothetical protein
MFDFIRKELTEARLLRNERNIPNSIDAVKNMIMTHLLALEIIRHLDPAAAAKYASNTISLGDFSSIKPGATDLHNLVSVIVSRESDELDIPADVSIPGLQLKQYLREMAREVYNESTTSEILFKVERYLKVDDSYIKRARRGAQNWIDLSESERKQVVGMLHRQFKQHSKRSDLYATFSNATKDPGKKGMSLAAKAAIAFAAGYALGKNIK